MKKNLSFLFVGLLSLGLLLSACGGGAPAPATFSQLPVFSGAKESTSEILVGALNVMTDALKGESTIKSVEGKGYDVPAGTTWDAIKSFYTPALEKSSWTAGPGGADTLSFIRGTQSVVVKYSESLGLIVLLTEAK